VGLWSAADTVGELPEGHSVALDRPWETTGVGLSLATDRPWESTGVGLSLATDRPWESNGVGLWLATDRPWESYRSGTVVNYRQTVGELPEWDCG
jgi:hypothetical protein